MRLLLVLMLSLVSYELNAKTKKNNKKRVTKIKTKKQKRTFEKQKYVVSRDQTSIDFSEASIDGNMKIPQGFFLQGRKSQSLTQMVKLRTNFRSELDDSKSVIKAIVK